MPIHMSPKLFMKILSVKEFKELEILPLLSKQNRGTSVTLILTCEGYMVLTCIFGAVQKGLGVRKSLMA